MKYTLDDPGLTQAIKKAGEVAAKEYMEVIGVQSQSKTVEAKRRAIINALDAEGYKIIAGKPPRGKKGVHPITIKALLVRMYPSFTATSQPKSIEPKVAGEVRLAFGGVSSSSGSGIESVRDLIKAAKTIGVSNAIEVLTLVQD